MRETGCPSFFVVLSYLFAVILSAIMIGWLFLCFLTAGMQVNSPLIFAIFLAFWAIGIYSGLMLTRGLFPAKMNRCKVCSLVKKIIEIDEVQE
ncbi:MAG: hypothetical protein CVV34_04590 [Methanomicrobiales archaeon HGW-Methanomicrobiales-5]|nr:MAG: hypothetical protein CVV34_04590 [Methanomicrobiales archaeon HGW-Methanomicrobiales-5]